MTALSTFIVALLVSMVLIPPLMASAEWLRIVDRPDARKLHAAPMPRVGGIAIIAGTCLPVILWLMDERAVLAYLAGAALILAFGVWDDRRQLGYRAKFLGQLAAVLVIVFGGEVVIRGFPLLQEPLPDCLAWPFTVFALIGVTNAINLADGLDGLAGGAALLSLGGIVVLAWLAGDHVLVVLALAVMGSVVGFLRYNTYPARVFMGDAGSQFLGYSVAVFTVLLTQRSNPALSPAVVLLLIGLPVIDTFLVISQRLREGRSPFRPDQNHTHHKLLALGFDHYEAVLAIYVAQALLVSLGYLLRYHADGTVLGVYAAVFAGIAGFFAVATRSGWRLRPPATAESRSALRRRVRSLRDEGVVERGAQAVCLAAGLVWCAVALAGGAAVPVDLEWLVAGMAALLLGTAFLRHGRPLVVAERAALYLTGSIVVFLLQNDADLPVRLRWVVDGLFIAVVLALAAAFRFGRNRVFRATPLDFLIVFVALALPALPDIGGHGPLAGDTVARLIVMFYACEYLLSRNEGGADRFRFALLVTLGLIALHGWS